MSFSLDLSKAVKNIKENTEEIIQGTIFQIFSNVIKATPVGNPDLWKAPPPSGYIGGTLRNSWHCTIGSASEAGPRRPNDSGVGSISSLSSIQAYKLGDTAYLSNNLPYAYRVEFGWSKQAPAGMVRVAIDQAQKVLDAQ